MRAEYITGTLFIEIDEIEIAQWLMDVARQDAYDHDLGAMEFLEIIGPAVKEMERT